MPQLIACLFPRINASKFLVRTTGMMFPRLACLQGTGPSNEQLTLAVHYASANGCPSGAPLTFDGVFTRDSVGVDGVSVALYNQDTNQTVGPVVTASGGYYTIATTAPIVTVPTTYHYYSYTL